MTDPVVAYQWMERLKRRTLLGIRFWDPALNIQIKDGLEVTLAPLENAGKIITAYRTRSGIYAFDNIPGMRALETGLIDGEIASPPDTRAYLLDVEDLSGQFSGVAQVVNLPLPYSGLFLVDSDVGSPAETTRGFNLYSAITRRPASQYTCIRGEVVNTDSDQPAAHALVCALTDEGTVWYGLSDPDGKFCVMMPYPQLHVVYGGSPPVNDGIRLFQRNWNITLSVLYSPSTLEQVPGSSKPNYVSILGQSPASIYQHSPGNVAGEVSELTGQLNYGRDLVVSTDGFSELYISPTGSPA